MLRHRSLQFLLVSLFLCVGVVFGGVVSAESAERPKLNVLRFNEDWSALKAIPEEEHKPLDAFKYIPLDDDGQVWFSLGGQARERFESFSNFGFGEANDDTYFLTRLRLHGDLHVSEYFRIFAEGKAAFSSERDLPGGARTLDVDELDVQNAFIDLNLPGDDFKGFLRFGRQEMAFGKQRLISPLDWSNTRRTFDGVLGQVTVDDWTVSAFYTLPTSILKYDFNHVDDDKTFYGLYGSGKLCDAASLDAYFLGLNNEAVTFNGTTGEEDRYTVGARVWGKLAEAPVDYDLETAYQFGDVGPGDIHAFMVASQLGYQFTEADFKPRVFVGFDYASGDDALGGDVETFNQLFPLGHAYLGWIDVVGRQNVMDLSGGVSFKPEKKTTAIVTGHYFWRASQDDSLYNAGGGVVRAGAAGSSQDIGMELDVLVKHALNTNTMLLAGYSHFFPQDFISESGSSKDIDFVYTSVQWTF